MREVNSRVIKAYARALESLKVAIHDDLTKKFPDDAVVAESFDRRIHEVAEDLWIFAHDLARKEFDMEWEKS